MEQIQAMNQGEEGRYFNLDYQQMGGFSLSLNEIEKEPWKQANEMEGAGKVLGWVGLDQVSYEEKRDEK